MISSTVSNARFRGTRFTEDSYAFTLDDNMRGLKYKSGRMYFVVMHDDGHSDYYDVTASFGMPVARDKDLSISQ